MWGGASTTDCYIIHVANSHAFRTADNASGGAISEVGSIAFEGGSVDPTIKAASAPSEGGTSDQPLGSLRLGTGGSIWYPYLDGATNKWTRMYSYQYHP